MLVHFKLKGVAQVFPILKVALFLPQGDGKLLGVDGQGIGTHSPQLLLQAAIEYTGSHHFPKGRVESSAIGMVHSKASFTVKGRYEPFLY